MIKYDKYKPSEIDWLGDIPNEWKIKRIKDVCHYVNRGTSPNYVESSDFKVVNQATFSKGFLNEDNIRFTSVISNKKSYLKNKDLLIASTGGGILGKTYYFEKEVGNYIADSHVTIIRDYKDNFVPKYFYYFFSENFKLINDVLAVGTTNQTELQRKYLLEFKISYPSIKEQTQIANYLDTKTRAIDKKIRLLTQKAKYYKEYRKSLINEAVCKGLPSTSSGNTTSSGNGKSVIEPVEMKDSGIDWIGKIPKHWEVKRFKDVLNIHNGYGFPIDEQGDINGTIPFYKVSDINGEEMYLNKCNNYVSNLVCKEKNWSLIPKYSIIVAKIGEALKKNHRKISIVDSLIDNNCMALSTKYNVSFFYWLLNIVDFSIFDNMGTVPSLSTKAFNSFDIAFPPLSEQTQIAHYLDQKTKTIDKIVSNIHTQIATLKELRKTLINDAVTGKIKVS